MLVQQIPMQRNLTLRLLEPLGAPEEPDGAAERRGARAEGPVAIQMTDVRVVAAGNQILAIDVPDDAAGEAGGDRRRVGRGEVEPGRAAARVAPRRRPARSGSTARRSTRARLEALRRRTVWVDPAVYLWNRSLAREPDLRARRRRPADLGAVLADAELGRAVSPACPTASATPLGEAGALVSGGEGQRVRFGRGLTRERRRW